MRIKGQIFECFNPTFKNKTVGNSDIKHIIITVFDNEIKKIIKQVKHKRNKYTFSITRPKGFYNALNLKIVVKSFINCIYDIALLHTPFNEWFGRMFVFELNENIFNRPDGGIGHVYYTLKEIAPL